MDFILTVITFIFVALILALAVTVGFWLLMWCIAVGLLFTIIIKLRQQWLRWRFVKNAEPATPDVIEGVFRDITDHRP
jgi:membrane protein implicated in regulation of membrane protease activity